MHHKINSLLQWLEDGLLIVTLACMILLALSQIILRNIFETGIDWSDPVLRILVLWLSLLGAIAATKQNNHISIDLFSRLLPAQGKLITAVTNNLFSAFICAVISYHSAQFVMMEYEDQIMAFGEIPAWVCEIIMPMGFGVMALRFLINAGSAIKHKTSQQSS